MDVAVRSWIRRRSIDPLSRFLPLFFLYMGLIVTLSYRADGFARFTLFLGELNASLGYWLLSRFAESVEVAGPTVTLDGFNVIVVAECAGLLEFMMYTAAVVAYPANWRAKLIGLLVGIPALFVFNVFRVTGLLVVGRYQPSLFHFTHIYFWQATMVLMIGALWIAWIRFVVHSGNRANDRIPVRS